MSWRGVLAIVVAVVLLDRATKLIVLATMEPGQTIAVLPGFFSFTFVRNPGAAFGMLADSSLRAPLLVAFAVAAVAGLGWLIAQTPESHTAERASAAAIIGGALGNLYDRFAYGSVVDFLDFYVGRWHWPAFNVADSCITVGVAVLLLASLRRDEGGGEPKTDERSTFEHRKAA